MDKSEDEYYLYLSIAKASDFAKHFIKLYGNQFAYVLNPNEFWTYKDGYWHTGKGGTEVLKELIDEVLDEEIRRIDFKIDYVPMSDEAERRNERYLASLKKNCSRGFKNQVLYYLNTHTAEPDEFNTDDYALNCLNCTVDWRTGKMRQHNS